MLTRLLAALVVASTAGLQFLLKDPSLLGPVLAGVLQIVVTGLGLLLPSLLAKINAKAAVKAAMKSAGASTALLLLVVTLPVFAAIEGCKDPQTVANVDKDILTAEQIGCVLLGDFASPADAALTCGIVDAAGDVTKTIFDAISKLLQAGKLMKDPAFRERMAKQRKMAGEIIWTPYRGYALGTSSGSTRSSTRGPS